MPGGFTVPYSSSPPSTPDSHRGFKRASGIGDGSLSPQPTTTPGGPPPSTTNSFTPAGVPPPSSIFGSSQVKPGSGLFASKQNPSNGQFSLPTIQNNTSSGLEKPVASARGSSGKTSLLSSTPIRPDQRGRTFAVPDASSPIDLTGINDDEDESDDDIEEDENDDQSDDLGASTASLSSKAHGGRPNVTNFKSSIHTSTQSSPGGIDWARSDFGSSIGAGPPRSPKRPRESVTAFDASSRQNPPTKRQKKDSAIPAIVEDMSRSLGVAKLKESDFLILGSEACVGKIYEVEALPEPNEKAIEEALPVATKELCDLWRACRKEGAQDMDMESDVIIGIGPNEDATTLQKATFVAPLLLQIHHPPPVTGKQAFASSKSFRSSHTASTRALDPAEPPTKAKSIPRVLHDWLEEHHDPYASVAVDLRIHTPNSTAHTNYWDILFNLLLRGKIFDVVETLRKSDFHHAYTAREETGSKGYDSLLVKNIKIVVNRMASAFEECPLLQEDDWDITGSSWRKFRKRLEQALADLMVFVEGSSGEQEPEFEAPNFGLRSTTSTLGQSVRNAERQLPLIIYENLKTMYGILLGKTPEIVSSAQDWVEATLGLTIWWDGEDDDDENLAASFMQSRRSLRRSQQNTGTRTVDLNSIAAYIRRLASAFERVTDADDPDLFQINSNNAVEVALASVFEGNVEGIMRLLRGWSLPVAAAVVQIASIGGWYETTAGAEKMNGFDQSDLVVLSSYSHPESGVSPDGVLVDYAEALFEKDALGNVAAADQVEGWELSMQILARLDDEALGTKKLSELLQQLPLKSDKRVDRLLTVCRSFGLDREACSIAERYADFFTNETEKYGNALVYYARAGCIQRVKNILDLLISLSLVESKAIPPVSSLDDNLRALIEIPQTSLAILRNKDPDAAQIIHHQLTGYACLRRFYDLRDAGFNNTKDPKIASLRPAARRKAAISTLVAVINSAADNIHGGLYDEDRGSIVPVDGLLALLGEALVFIDRPQREVSLSQCIDLLKAIEDLQTVTSRVYEQCEECFRCTLANRGSRRLKRPETREMLKKSISNMTASSSAFSFLGSEMIMGEETRESTGSEGVMVHMVEDANANANGEAVVQRGWDWRNGIRRDASGAELLSMLRLGLARDIAKAWIAGEEP
ncbi:MAG: hypothetical protein Q9182_001763 [Xanthomendoza sp. 2 TL-2023]